MDSGARLLHRPARVLVAMQLAAAALLVAAAAPAESSLRLPPPAVFGSIPSATFDEEGRRIGEARVDMTRLGNGNAWMMASSTIPDAESMMLSAELEPVDGGAAYRPVWQMSRSYDHEGRSLGIMFIDHRKGQAFCEHEQGSDEPPDVVELPQPDRVAHVPLNLLFLPLARGTADEIKFQFLLCALGPRVVGARARVEREIPARDGVGPMVEVRYELDLNRVLEAIARPFLPRFSFWLAPGARDPWMAHRMPLASKGPAVLVVRTGIEPASLAPAP